MAKVNLKTRWWKAVDDNNYYYLSHKGFLIVKKRYEYLEPKLDKETNKVFYSLYRKEKVYLETLYKELYGKEKTFDLSWYKNAISFVKKEKAKKIKQRRKKTSQKQKKTQKTSPYLRCCHDCGKPTTNYRCDECWAKIRGVKHGRPSTEDILDNFFDPDPDSIYPVHLSGGGFYG